ncbi:uncharacterized protein B0T15DRAFT_396538 [Chaetomium strumarium]|uniref:GED domain-containing protein n=1 Tax=Chaetomium strumarium TaxID=1170767 RepID=A0AAJ0M283_9PEZI|nr:hypothetical protein B0T15DRAFT_396538 [Chaetomium strumarium]
MTHRNRTSDVSIASDLEEGPTANPYDVRNERGPVHRFFTAEFQSTLQAGLGIAKDTLAELEGLDGLVQSDRDLERLLSDAKELCAFQGTDTKTIAVLGDSGEGRRKSSLINSLLHFPGIAKTGDIGSACTSVVTEYWQKTREHTAPITIEVEHLSGSATEDVIKELLWSYRQLYLPGVEDEGTSAEDYARYQRESAQAWSALEAAFKHKPEFKEEMLRDMSEGAMERLTEQLIGWSREIEWPDGTGDGVWRSTANTAEECARKTAVFMQDRYWPFTKVIRVYLNAQVLKTGVVLADLPGLQDTNLARVRATHDYLLKCNHIFIVAKISRAITDRSLQSSLFSVLSRHVPLEWEESAAQSLRIAVVCTKTEDIDIKSDRREFCGPDKVILDSVMDNLEAQIEDAKARGNRMQKKALKQQRELLLINARNAHVTSGLQAAYATKAPGGRLDVFCVSNKWYDKYSRKGNRELVQASGIPALRQFCHSLAADAQLREAIHFLRSRVFTLVNSAELWMDVFVAAINTLVADFRSCFVEQVLNIIGTDDPLMTEGFSLMLNKFADNRHQTWEKAAHAEAKPWRDVWSTQYDAWCRNNGYHCTPKRGRVDWNAKIIWKLRAELDFQWDIVQEEIRSVFDELLATVSEQFGALDTAVSTILSTTDGSSEFCTQLSAIVGPRIESMKYRLTRAQEKFARDVKQIRRYASEPSHGSYILDAMIPAYRVASNQYGTGKNKRQIDIIENRITDGVLFPGAAIALQDRIDALLQQLKTTLTSTLAQAVEDVATDLRFVLSTLVEIQRNDVGHEAERTRLAEVRERLGMLKVRAEDVCRALSSEES